MKTNKKQIKDLTLFEVDYMVAKAEGFGASIENDKCWIASIEEYCDVYYSPTTNPYQAWPIIDNNNIALMPILNESTKSWIAVMADYSEGYGKTSLEAAMRCRVASVYGNDVDI